MLFFQISLGQEVSKFRANSISIRFKDDKEIWKKWSTWLDSNVLTVFNSSEDRIVVYTEPKEVFDITKTQDASNNENNSMMFSCVDHKGSECLITLTYDNSGKIYIFLEYEKMEIAYNVSILK